MTHFPTQQQLAAEIGAVHAQAGGVITVEIVRKQDLAGILLSARLGDPWSRMIYSTVGQSGRRIESAPRNRPYLCACCPRAIRPGGKFAFVVAIPSCDDPAKSLGFAICTRCATTLPELKACAARVVAEIWPGSKPIEIHPSSGNA